MTDSVRSFLFRGSILAHFGDTETAHGFFIMDVLLLRGAEIIFSFFIDLVTSGKEHPGGMQGHFCHKGAVKIKDTDVILEIFLAGGVFIHIAVDAVNEFHKIMIGDIFREVGAGIMLQFQHCFDVVKSVHFVDILGASRGKFFGFPIVVLIFQNFQRPFQGFLLKLCQ